MRVKEQKQIPTVLEGEAFLTTCRGHRSCCGPARSPLGLADSGPPFRCVAPNGSTQLPATFIGKVTSMRETEHSEIN